jgi:hypothetical protein
MTASERGCESRHRIAHRGDLGHEAAEPGMGDVLQVIVALNALGPCAKQLQSQRLPNR